MLVPRADEDVTPLVEDAPANEVDANSDDEDAGRDADAAAEADDAAPVADEPPRVDEPPRDVADVAGALEERGPLPDAPVLPLPVPLLPKAREEDAPEDAVPDADDAAEEEDAAPPEELLVLPPVVVPHAPDPRTNTTHSARLTWPPSGQGGHAGTRRSRRAKTPIPQVPSRSGLWLGAWTPGRPARGMPMSMPHPIGSPGDGGHTPVASPGDDGAVGR